MENQKERINNVIEEQINNLKKLKESNYTDNLIKICEIIINAIENGNKLMIAGNGGSAADSQHIAAELIGRFKLERNALPAISLTTDTSILTCMGNDYGYDSIFSRQIEGLAQNGDIFIGISTSGNSKNIIEAVEKCKEKGVKTIGLLGKDGGILKKMCDESIVFNYSETARVQEHHIMTYHLMCEFIERYFYEKK